MGRSQSGGAVITTAHQWLVESCSYGLVFIPSTGSSSPTQEEHWQSHGGRELKSDRPAQEVSVKETQARHPRVVPDGAPTLRCEGLLWEGKFLPVYCPILLKLEDIL